MLLPFRLYWLDKKKLTSIKLEKSESIDLQIDFDSKCDNDQPISFHSV